ncbi:nitrous oxide-stimulated promoter family protein [Faecalicatena sp. AGMB00832]|uniref:Nitrous oxide-stimulated promoter family protein n=1 Tax=Faecalicatena faecalis TaxID=2726362 RepID=A0ABS6D7Y4_9FIRM|nr:MULTISPECIES: nitrous oxide-stimulated promoter family protein [Faecalicatena]MBU3877712.1 nitrous oxide-stimulated promoter family protein [Faecalicatena faecalis]MCI6466187.1 nitrous oxide-stimulated promoter family protein [Faecalicatena sp.]MDY5619353.1 nitrous oxide-stimulated promoter family protein [Lachnospiraceae bacterium]
MSKKSDVQKEREQERIRQVMRYAGRRMLFVHPVMAMRHVRGGTIKEKRRQTS